MSNADAPSTDGTFATHQAHDAFVKQWLSDTSQARILLQSYLPAEVCAWIDWSTLRLDSTGHVKSSLAQTHSDILFVATLAGWPVEIGVLIEHQTTVDRFLRVRLLDYKVQRWLRLIQESRPENERHQSRKLPVIITLVLHQGPDRWTPSRSLRDLFDIPAEAWPHLQSFVPDFTHELIDLSQAAPEDEDIAFELKATLKLMKLVRLEAAIEGFFDWLCAQPQVLPSSLVLQLIRYVFAVRQHVDVDAIVHSLRPRIEYQSNMMTIEQMIEARGETRGEARGVALGEARGLVRGKLEMLREMMGLPKIDPQSLTALSLEALQAAFTQLEAEYAARFKR